MFVDNINNLHEIMANQSTTEAIFGGLHRDVFWEKSFRKC